VGFGGWLGVSFTYFKKINVPILTAKVKIDKSYNFI
jgi:hypothetical protein